MMVVDKIVTWYIQHILMPRQEIIDKPGFLITSLSGKTGKSYLRDLLLPEGFLEKVETKVVDKYGDRGRQALYSAGKKFAYAYASLSEFPQLGKAKDADVTTFSYFFVRFIAGTYASDANHEIDLKAKKFRIYLKDYVVCRHNGIGLIMTDGSIAGTWAWVCNDPSIDGIQIKCQGRGDKMCEAISAPRPLLLDISKNILTEPELPIYKFDKEYSIKNSVRETAYSKNSLKTLLDGKFFEYKSGIMSYKGRRMFLDDSHILSILENEISTLPGGADILFEAAFEEGKEIAEAYGSKDWNKFIIDYLSALGFGDIAVLDAKNPKIGLIYYPWTVFSPKSKYTVVRGLISGIITECSGKKVLLKLSNVTDKEFLTITVGV